MSPQVLYSGVLCVTLYDDYVNFNSKGLQFQNVNAKYTDIYSIGYGNDPSHSLLLARSITVNVRGHAYVFHTDPGGDKENKIICDAIQKKIDSCQAQAKGTEDVHLAETVNTAVSKAINNTANKQTITQTVESQRQIHVNPNNVEPTILRISMLIEDEEWDRALDYCEAGLDYFPTDYRLYEYALFAENRVVDADELAKKGTLQTSDKYYKRIIRFGDEKVKAKYQTLEEKKAEIEKKQRDRKKEELIRKFEALKNS